jgi:hypothetical protein
MLTLVALLSSEDLFIAPRDENKRAEAKAAHAHFAHSSGDHVTLLRIYAAWMDHDMDPQWCREHYLRYRALKAAKSVRDQLEEIARKVGLELKSCRRRRDKDDRRRDRNRDRSHSRADSKLDDYDWTLIAQSLCTGFFVNTAKRHPQRPYFYHYLSSASNISDSNSSLLSLHVSPSSCFSDETLSMPLDWVVYHDVQFVNRANLRIISKIDFSWVEKDLKRVSQCPIEKLVKSAGGTFETPDVPGNPKKMTDTGSLPKHSSDNASDVSLKRKRDDDHDKKGTETNVHDNTDTKPSGNSDAEKERLSRIEAAKARYLARAKK